MELATAIVSAGSLTELPNIPRPGLLGESTEMLRIKELIRHVSRFDANILLSGESGTGKEVVAQAIHAASPRGENPFIAVNCGAIPEDLIESELFGHEKGSFTGANSTRRGRFEMAAGGTIFLDEIGDMPFSMQVKLLRVIQERCFERVGGTRTIHCGVRIIAATHRNLEKRVQEGKFREDLFYRLNVFPIELPPLRDRASDIPLLLQRFAKQLGIEMGAQNTIAFDHSAIDVLCRHQFPGNVRELRNLVERLTIQFPGQTISADELPDQYQYVANVSSRPMLVKNGCEDTSIETELGFDEFDLKAHLTSMEIRLICRALDQTNWIVSQAAKLLNLQRTTLIQKMRRFQISPGVVT